MDIEQKFKSKEQRSNQTKIKSKLSIQRDILRWQYYSKKVRKQYPESQETGWFYQGEKGLQLQRHMRTSGAVSYFSHGWWLHEYICLIKNKF